MRVAVVGLGKMGILHSCLLAAIPDVEVAALCEKNGMVRRFLKKVFAGARIVDDVQKLSGLELDGVYVSTPISSHFPIAKTVYLYEIARNLFVEKTLAANYYEAQELCRLADGAEGLNMVGYVRRFSVTFKKAKQLLSKGSVGEISSFEAYAYSADFDAAKQSTSASVARGGVLRDLGCHAIDLALWFFGDLHVASADAKSRGASCPSDSMSFRVKGFNDLEGKFSVSWGMPGYRMPEVGLLITGSGGKIAVNDDKVELMSDISTPFVWHRHDLDDNVPFWLGLPEYYREDLHFVKSFNERHVAQPGFHAASKVDEIIDQVVIAGGNNE